MGLFIPKSSNGPRRRRASVGLESLESRVALAGDVTVAVTNGLLTITGDGAGNQIWVAQRGDRTVIAPSPWEAAGPTRIRFGAAVGLPRVELHDVHAVVIDLRGGNDVLVMGGPTSDPLDFRALTVNLGEGTNSLTAQGMVVGQQATVRSGSGPDSIRFEQVTFQGAATIQTGNGENMVSVTNSSISGPFEIVGGQHDDWIRASEVTASTFLVRAGEGNDRVHMRSVSTGPESLTVGLGNGHNEATFITVSVGGRMTVAAGSGQDVIETRIVDVRGPLAIDAGDGNNKIKMRATFALSGQVSTGQGVDRVEISGSGRYTEELRLRTGVGDDVVSLLSIETGSIDVDLGSGNDAVLLQMDLFHRRTRFAGGLGRDTVRFVSGEFSTKFFDGFEIKEHISA